MDYCTNNSLFVELTDDDLKFLQNFSDKKSKAKTIEWKGFDDKNRAKRELTGACIEYGILKFFGREKDFDDSIVAESYKKNYPDLLPFGVVCDVKGSYINNVPLVFKRSRSYVCHVGNHKGRRYRCANVLGITNQRTVWILGIASPRILEEYVDDNLIIISKNSSKTGFYGADKLVDIPRKWDDFKHVCSESSLIL